MESEDINYLGQVMDTTWGKSSTMEAKDNASMSVKANFLGKPLDGPVQVLLQYTTIMSFGSLQEREDQMTRYSRDGESVLNAALTKIKADFKELAGRTLKTNQIHDDDDWELLSLGQHSGRRDAYYRKKIIIEVT